MPDSLSDDSADGPPKRPAAMRNSPYKHLPFGVDTAGNVAGKRLTHELMRSLDSVAGDGRLGAGSVLPTTSLLGLG